MPRQLRREDYTVGWVCALPVELAAAKAMLDERHADASRDVGDSEENVYCMGSIAGHNVVIVCLPAGHIGNNPAATVATQMRTAFKSIRFGLMVGIGGGVPSAKADIRLGDVVVSQPRSSFGGVVQYDFGRATPDKFERIGALNSPPQILLSAVSYMQSNEIEGESTLYQHLSVLECIPAFQRRRAGPDILFKPTYNHNHGGTCDQCSVKKQQPRPEREKEAEVTVHYGTIASGNQVIKDAAKRDKISMELGGVLCFEMEAAGLMNSFPCLVIRGISDYADSHKNDKWQTYAAGTAAAYAKELLSVIPASEVINILRVEDAMSSGQSTQGLQPSSPHQTSDERTKTDTSSSISYDLEEQRTITLSMRSKKPSRTPLSGGKWQNLLDTLRFSQIDSRQMTIKTAHAKTCTWLLKNEQYLDWLDTQKLDEHHGFLWIKGKAGTGKSTLMKFALVNAHKMKDHIVLSFFFNARGENLEKSIIGTYRSLLLQLLESLPALQNDFGLQDLLPPRCFDESYQWNAESLKVLLEHAIRSLGDLSVICIIDALDECEEEQIRDMIQFFEHIGDLAVSNNICFQICFSSRHYPYITIRNGLELVLERQEGHSQDITNYVETELKIGKSKIAQQIRAELKEKASGIFIWVVLVVRILNKEYDDGQVHALRRKLKAIPRDLHKLFHDILTRDSHNKGRLVLCIQWVLFAKQPLTPEQLYHALLLSIDPDAISEWDPEVITKDDIKRFLLNSSKGLTEVTASPEPRIQFIHESVKDFLLKENSLSKIWPEFGSNFQDRSHEQLKQYCLDYINLATLLNIPDDLPDASSPGAESLRTSATHKFPLLEYATCSVLYHADAARSGGITQTKFLDSFPLPRWIKLNNLFAKYQAWRYTERVTLLYILAELDMADLIRVYPSVSSCLDIEDERYGCAFFAANVSGSQKAMQACIEGLKASQLMAGQCKSGLEENSTHETIEGGLPRDFKYTKKVGIALYAVKAGSVTVCSYLIKMGVFNFDSKDAEGRFPLYLAAEKGARILTRMLLDEGANVNAQGGVFGNVLQVASFRGHKEIVILLLDRGADINAQGGYFDNALQAATYSGHKNIVTLLLDRGANVNAESREHGNALQGALARGRNEIAKLLIDKGAKFDVQSEHFGNILQAASYAGHKELVTILLDKSANINALRAHYDEALQVASYKGNKQVVQMLLDAGANTNAQGRRHNTALEAALRGGHEKV